MSAAANSLPHGGTLAPCDPCRCPLCGQANACAREAARAKAQRQGLPLQEPACWCVNLHFPEALLARVPPAARGLACLCQACVEAAASETPKGAADAPPTALREAP